MKYSIITPNYNGFLLMEKYFESLNKQSFKDFEILIIDDCSTDGSYEKIKEYAAVSKLNIKVFKTKKNSGPGTARNIGIENASGEWITYIDNDDWVDDNFLTAIDDVIKNNEVNCVIYDYYICKKGNSNTVSRSMYNGEPGIVSVAKCMVYARNHTIGKFYKLSNCKEIRFPENLRRCEDVAYVARAIDACGSVYYLKKPLYFYYQRPASLSNNRKLDEGDMKKAFSIIEETLGEKYPDEIMEKSVTDLLYGSLLMMCKSGKNRKEIFGFIEDYEKKYPFWYKCRIIDILGKPKKIFLILAKYKCYFGIKFLSYLHSRITTG